MICALNGLITGDTPAACIPDDEPHSSLSDLLSITHPSPFRGRTGFQFTCGRSLMNSVDSLSPLKTFWAWSGADYWVEYREGCQSGVGGNLNIFLTSCNLWVLSKQFTRAVKSSIAGLQLWIVVGGWVNDWLLDPTVSWWFIHADF